MWLETIEIVWIVNTSRGHRNYTKIPKLKMDKKYCNQGRLRLKLKKTKRLSAKATFFKAKPNKSDSSFPGFSLFASKLFSFSRQFPYTSCPRYSDLALFFRYGGIKRSICDFLLYARVYTFVWVIKPFNERRHFF